MSSCHLNPAGATGCLGKIFRYQTREPEYGKRDAYSSIRLSVRNHGGHLWCGLAKGYHQDQLLFGGTIFGSVDDAKGIIGTILDYRLPWTERFFFSAIGAVSFYPRQRAYTEVPRLSSDSIPPPAGTNDSNEDNYIEDAGDDNWLDLKLEYVLPIGSMKESGIAEYHIQNGLLKSGATGGESWNPLESGVSVLLFGQTSRYQSYETDTVTYDGDEFPFQVG